MIVPRIEDEKDKVGVMLGGGDDLFLDICDEEDGGQSGTHDNYSRELQIVHSGKRRRYAKICVGSFMCCLLVTVAATVMYMKMKIWTDKDAVVKAWWYNNDDSNGNDDNISPSVLLRVINDGPYFKGNPALVTFSLFFSGNNDLLALYTSTRFHMKCCDSYEMEMLYLPTNISLTFDFDLKCNGRAFCDFELSFVSDSDPLADKVYSATNNMTTFTYSNNTVLVDPQLLHVELRDVDWGCNETSMWTEEVEPWLSLSVGDILLSEFNGSTFDDLMSVTNYDATSCDVLSRHIENITGWGTGTLRFQTKQATFNDIFSDIELDWASVLSRAIILPLKSSVNVTVESNVSYRPFSAQGIFDDDTDVSFQKVYPFDIKLSVSQNFGVSNNDIVLGASLGVHGGLVIEGSYQKTALGRTGSIGLELQNTKVELEPFFELKQSKTLASTISLGEYKLLSMYVLVGPLPLNIKLQFLPKIYSEITVDRAVKASAIAALDIEG